MHILKSIKSDRQLLNLLAKQSEGNIESIFDRAINIELKNDGTLVTIIDNQEGLVPLGVTVCNPLFNFFDLKQGLPVSLSLQSIKIRDSLIVNLNGCQWIDTTIKRVHIDRKLAILNLNEVRKMLSGFKPGYGLISLTDLISQIISGSPAPCLPNYLSKAYNLFSELFNKLGKTSIEDQLSHLVGFGWGTTPSADDILLGIIVAMEYLYGSQYLSSFNPVISLAKKTTSISYKYLTQAMAGHISERLANFMEALLSGHPQLVPAIEALDKTGASSGKEIMLGVALGLSFYLQNHTGGKL